MKKILESGKLWTMLSVLVFIMTCGVLTWAVPGNTNGDSTSSVFSRRKANKMGNMLTGGSWDDLMDTLDGHIVPQGAIVAFMDVNECPTGWTRYNGADGRFMMGSSSNFGEQGGSNSITLSADQLPPHQHKIRYGVASEYGDNANNRPVVVDWSTGKYPWSESATKMSSSTNSGRRVDTIETAPQGGGNSIDITNAYVKVIFCKKN